MLSVWMNLWVVFFIHAFGASFGRINVIFLGHSQGNPPPCGSSPFQSRECLWAAMGTGCHCTSAWHCLFWWQGLSRFSFMCLIQNAPFLFPELRLDSGGFVTPCGWETLPLGFTTELFQDGLIKCYYTRQYPSWSELLLILLSFWETYSI